jgi:hypothetical protein
MIALSTEDLPNALLWMDSKHFYRSIDFQIGTPRNICSRLPKNSRWIGARFHKGDIVIRQIDTMLRCSTRV